MAAVMHHLLGRASIAAVVLTGVVCSGVLRADRAHAQAQGAQSAPAPNRPPPRPAARRSPGQNDTERPSDRLFVLSDVFKDARWHDLVVDTSAERPAESSPLLERQGGGEAALQPLERGSIDQDVLQRMIADRARRLAMRAVVDVISDTDGAIANRQYVRDFVGSVTELLVDRTGMQNTRIEELVGVLARALVAEAIVRMRFPNEESVTDPCNWRSRVFDEPARVARRRTGDDRGQQCRDEPLPSIGLRCRTADGAPAPALCSLRRAGPLFIPWTPTPEEGVDHPRSQRAGRGGDWEA
jgi:hypothetical protein